MGGESRGVGEDEVVNIGVFDGGVGVLMEAVEEHAHTKEGRERDNWEWTP